MAVSTLDDGRRLEIEWPDGHRRVFHAVWLRDNCGCADCRHPSGQRLFEARTLPEVTQVVTVDVVGDRVDGTFADGHPGVWKVDWLRTVDGPPPSRAPHLWDATLQSSLPEFEYGALREWLGAVDELGFAILRNGPTAEGTVLETVNLFGFARETNYGRLFDVRSVVNPSNLAFTSLALGAHTDNPYRDPTPTLQLLHCISSTAAGGDSTLVDGFRVARDLPNEHFALLARHPVRFRYADETTDLSHETPILDVDQRGELRSIHFNTRSAQPLSLPADVMAPYYEAYRELARMLDAPHTASSSGSPPATS
jgi:gamma-butyrobetaine dioxygenase